MTESAELPSNEVEKLVEELRADAVRIGKKQGIDKELLSLWRAAEALSSLKGEVEEWRSLAYRLGTDLLTEQARALKAEAKNKELSEALGPFGSAFERFGSDCITLDEYEAMRHSVNVNDYRQAARSLLSTEGGGLGSGGIPIQPVSAPESAVGQHTVSNGKDYQ